MLRRRSMPAVLQVTGCYVAGGTPYRRRSPKIRRPATPECTEGRLPSQVSEKMGTCDTTDIDLRRKRHGPATERGRTAVNLPLFGTSTAKKADFAVNLTEFGTFTAPGRMPVDQVRGIFGRGPIMGAGPAPPIVPQRCLGGRCAGPGPGDKSGPGPNIPHPPGFRRRRHPDKGPGPHPTAHPSSSGIPPEAASLPACGGLCKRKRERRRQA